MPLFETSAATSSVISYVPFPFVLTARSELLIMGTRAYASACWRQFVGYIPRMRCRFAAGAILWAIVWSCFAAADERQEVQELYRRGLAGDAAAVEQCIGKLERVLQTEPQNQLARVYLGSAYTLRSRDLGFGPNKLQTLKQGLAVMDEAVAAAPQEPKVRLARALTTSALPAIFGRAGSARKDFEQLAEMAEANATKFDEGDLQIVFYNAGLAAKKAGDPGRATVLFKEALRHPADAAVQQKVLAELSRQATKPVVPPPRESRRIADRSAAHPRRG